MSLPFFWGGGAIFNYRPDKWLHVLYTCSHDWVFIIKL